MLKLRRVYIPEMTWEEVKEALREVEVAIVPVGSTEQHGLHLPLQSDTAFVLHICRRAAEEVYPIALVTPPIPIGISRHHMKFPGTLTLREETLIDVLMDVGWSLKQHGFRRIAIINGHGGNYHAMKIAAKKIWEEFKVLTASLSYWELLPVEEASRIIETFRARHAGHACEFETSLSYVIQPELVRRDKIRRGEGIETSIYQGFLPLDVFERSETGLPRGDPTKASPEKGRKLLELIVRELSKFLRTFGRMETPER